MVRGVNCGCNGDDEIDLIFKKKIKIEVIDDRIQTDTQQAHTHTHKKKCSQTQHRKHTHKKIKMKNY